MIRIALNESRMSLSSMHPPRRRLAALLCAILILSACQPRPTESQAVAREYLRAMVEQPEPPGDPVAQALRWDLSTRIRLDYLRTRHRQGVPLYYHLQGETRVYAGTRVVRLRVSPNAGGSPQPGDVTFALSVQRAADGNWSVSGARLLSTDDGPRT